MHIESHKSLPDQKEGPNTSKHCNQISFDIKPDTQFKENLGKTLGMKEFESLEQTFGEPYPSQEDSKHKMNSSQNTTPMNKDLVFNNESI